MEERRLVSSKISRSTASSNKSKPVHETWQQDAIVERKATRVPEETPLPIPPDQYEKIDRFVAIYTANWAHYDRLAQRVKNIIEEGARSYSLTPLPLCTARAKDPDSVNRKLRRQRGDSFWDYADLVGIRVLLYYPDHAVAIEKLLIDKFDDVQKKRGTVATEPVHSEDQAQYRAEIYRIKIKESDRVFVETPEERKIIEVQVVSILMHTWAEVEHKRYKGIISDSTPQENRVLEELNDIVLAGERKLQELYRLYKAREDGIYVRGKESKLCREDTT